MLFVAIVIVLVIYAGLYLVWDASSGHLHDKVDVVRSLTDALLRPSHDAFWILRSVLILALLYVVADFLYSALRRAVKRRKDAAPVIQPTFTERHDHIYRDAP